MSQDTTTHQRPEVTHDLITAQLYSDIAAQEHQGAFAAKTIERIGVNPMPYEVAQLEAAKTRLAEAQAAFAELAAALAEHESAYTGWSRFFLVTSSQGHIHSSLQCTTCYPTTTYGWLPTLSGLTEADAVEEQGMILCSVCFPSAPVEWTEGVAKTVLAEREAKAAAKAERATKKLAKALLPDGSPLRVGHDRLATLQSAKMWMTDAAGWKWNHPSYKPEDVQTVAEAIAAKTGETVEEIKAAADKRAAKRGY